MELTGRHLLIEHLNRLEQQAATVASLLDLSDAELMQEVADAFAPLPLELRYTGPKQRDRWRRQWCDWLAECANRWEARPPAHPSGEAMGELLLAWCRRT
jgi:hypothetical protein